jgi:Flp pilus assembly protein TadD
MCAWKRGLWIVVIVLLAAVTPLASCGGEDGTQAQTEATARPTGTPEISETSRSAETVEPAALVEALSRVAKQTRAATPDDPPEKKNPPAENKASGKVERPRTFWELMNLSREERKKLQQSMSMQEYVKFVADMQKQMTEQTRQVAEAQRGAWQKRQADEKKKQEQRREEEARRLAFQQQQEQEERAVALMREGCEALQDQDYRAAGRAFERVAERYPVLAGKARYYLAETTLRQSRQVAAARSVGRRRGGGRSGRDRVSRSDRGRGTSARGDREHDRSGDRTTGRRISRSDRKRGTAARGDTRGSGLGVDPSSENARRDQNNNVPPALPVVGPNQRDPRTYVSAFELWLQAYENAPELWPFFSREPFQLAAWGVVVDVCGKSGEPVNRRSAAAWRALTNLLVEQKDDSIAARTSREWFALDDSPETHFRHLQLQQWSKQGRGKINRDRNLYDPLLKRDDVPPALRSKALVHTAYALWKDRIACEETVREALGLDQSNGEAWWVLAHVAIRNQDRVRAEELLQECAKLAPRNSHVRSVRAAVLMVVDRDADAVRSIEEATRINGQASANWFTCSSFLEEKLDNPALALTALVRAAEAGTDGKCWLLVSLRHRKAGNLKEATDALQKAVRQGADTVENLTLLGECHLGLGKQAEAEAAYGRAMARHPESPVPWNSYRVQSLGMAVFGKIPGVSSPGRIRDIDLSKAVRLVQRATRSAAPNADPLDKTEVCLRIAGEIERLAARHGYPWAACAEIGLLHACAGDIDPAVGWYVKAFDQTGQESLRDNLRDLSKLAPEQLQPLARGILKKRVSLNSLVRVREFVRLQQAEQEARARSLAQQQRYFGRRHYGGGYNQAQAEASRAGARAERDYRNYIASHFGYLGF